ncbi:MAG: M23 family metallopeptidase [Clostridia bacterium]|nr:M23 family metallopeptidase [Clostridia bacterium]
MNLGTIKDKTGKSILRKKVIKKAFAAAAVCCVAVVAVSAAISLTNKAPDEVPSLEAPKTDAIEGNSSADVKTPGNEISADKTPAPDGSGDGQVSANTSVTQKMLLPVTGGNVLKGYAEDMLVYSSTLKHWSTHTALDLAATEGASVLAVLDGTVAKVENDALMGHTVTISHGNGYETKYASLGNVAEGIEEGAKVLRGQAIGDVGTSASSEAADGAHLHFEVLLNGKPVNPQTYLSDFLK